MTDSQHEALLAAWLDGELTEAQRRQFEALCTSDAAFARQVEAANRISDMASTYTTFAVPHWNREATFTPTPRNRWWQWQGLPVASMAMSALALVMVVTGFRVDIRDDRVSLGFGSSQPDPAQITALIDSRVQQYQQANQQLFAQYTDALAQQQRQSGAELTEYLLSSSRQERREDFAELVKFINQQRSDDQRFYARQLNHLQQEISALENGQAITPLVPFTGPSDDE
ncbi:hypothetical protein [Alteromonas sp. CYL-A6]|uniref:hypothetical protein n=1 Tax=Alteromonas nitratireducens TaxID=3390813 RepID=UPI0034C47044